MKNFVLILLTGAVGFLGYIAWSQKQVIYDLRSGHAAMNGGEQEQIILTGAEESSAREVALEGFKNAIREKGAKILDSRVFESAAACQETVAKIVTEYQRRGIEATNVADVSAFLGIQGSVMLVKHLDSYLYLFCATAPDASWAAYVQFSLTERQIEKLNEEQQRKNEEQSPETEQEAQ